MTCVWMRPMHDVLDDLEKRYDINVGSIGRVGGKYVFHHGIVVRGRKHVSITSSMSGPRCSH